MNYDLCICWYDLGDKSYFAIDVGMDNYETSKALADLFNTPIDTYNQILIEKVIMHDKYYVSTFSNAFAIEYEKDVMFNLNGVPKEVYLDRFKEAFAPQLTLLTLEGDSFES